MDSQNNSLEQSYSGSAYDSSLEAGGTTVVPLPAVEEIRHDNFSPFKLNKAAFLITGAALAVIALIVGIAFVLSSLGGKPSNGTANSQQPDNFAVSTPALSDLGDGQLQVQSADTLAINGQLKVNKTLVLTPTNAPAAPTAGEIYYDQTTNQPYVYNGSAFVSLTPAAVNTIGGSSGAISLGSSLQISGNTLGVSSTFLQAVSGGLNSPRVTSLQGLTGAVTLTGSTGIAISGTSIRNTGVVNLTAGSSGSLVVTNNGNGNFVVDLTGSGQVVLGPSSPQTDASTNDAISIDKTGSGNLLNLLVNGAATFVVDNTGVITASSTGNTINGLVINGGGLSNVTGITTSGAYTQTGNDANTFSGAVNVASSAGLTIGTANISDGLLTLTNAANGHVTTVRADSSISQDQVITIPVSTAATDTVCLLTLANCVGAGGGVASSGGTPNALARFTGAQTIGDSAISDDGVTVVVSRPLESSVSVTTPLLQSAGALTITPGGTLTAGASSQILTLQGNANSTLKISSGGFTTTVGFTIPSADRNIIFPDEGGIVCIQNSTDCGFAAGGSGVTSLNGILGALSIANASAAGSTVTINNASTSGKGIAQFSSTNFTASAGVIDTIQGISTAASPTFAGLTLTGDVTLAPGHTVYTDTVASTSGGSGTLNLSGSDNITFWNQNGANSFLFPTTGGTGQVICTSGITCASGGGQAVILEPGSVQTSNSSSTPGIFINKASGTANLIQLQTSGVNAFVIGSNGNTTISNTTTITSLVTNTITPTAALTIGSTGQGFTLQGTGSSLISAAGGGYTTSLGFNIGSGGTAPTGDVTYQLQNDNSVLPGTYTICTTAGNCAGVGGSVTTSGGVAGKLAIYTSASNLGNSIISDTGTAVTVGGNLSVGVANTTAGNLIFNSATTTNNVTFQLATAPTGNRTINVPNASGTLAVSASGVLVLDAQGNLTCPTCLGSGGGAGGVSDITGTTVGSSAINGALTLNNALTTGTSITIDDASTSQKGIAQFNSTNFSVSGGVVNTIQSIATNANPIFGDLTLHGANGLTLGSNLGLGNLVFRDGSTAYKSTFSSATLSGNQTVTVPNASGTLAVSASGNLALSALGNLTIVNNPTFTTSVTTPSLKLNASGAYLVTLQSTQANNLTLTIPADVNTSDTLCLQTLNNCAGSGVTNGGAGSGNLNYITKFHTGAGSQIEKSQIYDDGTFVGINTTSNSAQLSVVALGSQGGFFVQGAASGSTDVALIASGGSSGNLLNLTNNVGTTLAKFDNTGKLTAAGGTFNGNVAVASSSTFTVGTGLTTLGGGLTATGTTNINATGTASTVIGSLGGTLELYSSNYYLTAGGSFATNSSISAGGNVGGATLSATGAITAATSSNTINGLVINAGALSNIASLTQTVTTANTLGGSLTLGLVGSTAGSLILANATSSRSVVFNAGNPSGTGNFTVSLPGGTGGTSDTVCLQALNNCSGAGGGSGYIQNLKPSGGTPQTANFFIQSGDTGNNTTAVIRATASQTAAYLLQFQNSGGTNMTSIESGGGITFAGSNALSSGGVLTLAGSTTINLNAGGSTRAILTANALNFQQATTINAASNAGAGYAMTLAGGASTGGNGGSLSLQGGSTSAVANGGTVAIAGGQGSGGGAVNINGGLSTTTSTGSNVTILGGAATSGTGGNVVLSGGTGGTNPGQVIIKPQSTNSQNFFQIQNAASQWIVQVDASNKILWTSGAANFANGLASINSNGDFIAASTGFFATNNAGGWCDSMGASLQPGILTLVGSSFCGVTPTISTSGGTGFALNADSYSTFTLNGGYMITGSGASTLKTTSGGLTITSASGATWSTANGYALIVQSGSGSLSLGTTTTLTNGSGGLTITPGAGALTVKGTSGYATTLGQTNNTAATSIFSGTGGIVISSGMTGFPASTGPLSLNDGIPGEVRIGSVNVNAPSTVKIGTQASSASAIYLGGLSNASGQSNSGTTITLAAGAGAGAIILNNSGISLTSNSYNFLTASGNTVTIANNFSANGVSNFYNTTSFNSNANFYGTTAFTGSQNIITTLVNGANAFTVQDSANTSLLNVNSSTGLTTIRQLTVTTALTASSTLTVTGNVTLNGANLYVKGHIGGGVGADASATVGTVCTGSMAYSNIYDSYGTVTINTTSCSGTGNLLFVDFNTDYTFNPSVILTPANANAATLEYYTFAGTAGFYIVTSTTPANGSQYTFSYHVFGR